MTSIAQLTSDALSLPVDDRIRLAQRLWESLQDSGNIDSGDNDAKTLELAEQRDDELTSGSVKGISHADAIAKARKSVE